MKSREQASIYCPASIIYCPYVLSSATYIWYKLQAPAKAIKAPAK
jgi:hypothetical protein